VITTIPTQPAWLTFYTSLPPISPPPPDPRFPRSAILQHDSSFSPFTMDFYCPPIFPPASDPPSHIVKTTEASFHLLSIGGPVSILVSPFSGLMFFFFFSLLLYRKPVQFRFKKTPCSAFPMTASAALKSLCFFPRSSSPPQPFLRGSLSPSGYVSPLNDVAGKTIGGFTSTAVSFLFLPPLG